MQNMVESFQGDSTRVESPKGLRASSFRASVRKSFRDSTLMRDATKVLEIDNFITRYCINGSSRKLFTLYLRNAFYSMLLSLQIFRNLIVLMRGVFM